MLDIAMRADDYRVWRGKAVQNVGVPRQVALDLLPQEHTATMRVKAKRLTAGWGE